MKTLLVVAPIVGIMPANGFYPFALGAARLMMAGLILGVIMGKSPKEKLA